MPRGHKDRRTGAARARLVLVSGLAVFVLGQLVLSALLQSHWRVARDPVGFTRLDIIHRKLRDAARAVPTADPRAQGKPRLVLFLGTSRVEFGVQTLALEPQLSRELGEGVAVANWGRGGFGYLRDLLAWRRLEREGIKPDLVMIELFPAYLSDKHRLDIHVFPLPTNELDEPDIEVIRRYDPKRKKIWRDRLEAWLVPAYSYRNNIMHLLSPQLGTHWGRPLSELGGDLRDTWPPERQKVMLAKMRDGYTYYYRDFRMSAVHAQALDELLASLSKAHVPTVLFVMPEGPQFRSWYPPGLWRKIEDHLAGLTARYGVPVVSLREWMQESDFNDSHHLTGEGADRFSERLGREVLAPLLRRHSGGGADRLPSLSAR